MQIVASTDPATFDMSLDISKPKKIIKYSHKEIVYPRLIKGLTGTPAGKLMFDILSSGGEAAILLRYNDEPTWIEIFKIAYMFQKARISYLMGTDGVIWFHYQATYPPGKLHVTTKKMTLRNHVYGYRTRASLCRFIKRMSK